MFFRIAFTKADRYFHSVPHLYICFTLSSSLISLHPPFLEVRLLKISNNINGANAYM